MQTLDLNLLTALDALLTEGSVVGAARRLDLSASAMSRTLARLRAATGDPLLVRAGRGLVPTPRATALRDEVHALVRDVRRVLGPQTDRLDLASLDRTFVIRANDGFVDLLAASLVTTVAAAAPHVRLRFAPKPDKDAGPLREGRIDLEIGVLGASAPEVRTSFLFRDDFVGAARTGHPLLDGPVSAERYAACKHVVASRTQLFTGPVDAALEQCGMRRDIAAVVGSYRGALSIARRSDLLALVPRSCFAGGDPGTEGVVRFELPVHTPGIVISAMWHPRMDRDPAHRWLRDTVIALCRTALPQE
ncbi:LysR family transcriptional regulator [Flavisphingomonas formosensis]|uniref:LysR family transcriptional regulator n=1 Tax=Flavisphingomonas formosensis TaxID=861534 RepID=UPI0012F7EEC3|nr:LysR family transcriptional regulator [Sphingomonas formosensis]